jgi:gliding motility-associated-like protein
MVMDTVTFCEAEDWLRITVDRNRKVFIPNAFSPNGDGNNDVFFLQSANDVTLVRSLRIFSRTGQLVHLRENFAPNDPNYGWDGLFREQPLAQSVFVYVAEIEFYDGKTEIFKGDVILVR